MRVAILLPFFHVGGVERWATHATNELTSRGHYVELLCFGKISAPSSMFGGGNNPQRVQAFELLRLCFGRRRPDVIITALSKLNMLLAAFGRFRGIRVICSVHLSISRKTHESWLKYFLRRLAHRFIISFADAVICVSEGVSAELRQLARAHGSKLCCIYNPCFHERDIYIREPTRPQTGRVRFVAAGRLHLQKGFDLLIEAFSQLPDRILKIAELDIFGSGTKLDELTESVPNRLRSKINFRGDVPDLPLVLREYDVFVLSSRYEGFGNVLAEGLAAGCACVAFDVPHGPREILDDGRFGQLVPTLTSAALRDALLDAAERRDARHSVSSSELRTHLMKFTSETFGLRLDNLLSEIGKSATLRV